MKRFKVIISPSAEADIAESFAWGLAEWGLEPTEKWAGQVRREIAKLSMLPLRCPVAPESQDLNIEIRQLIIGRYRVLFHVVRQTVRVLHLRGAFVEKDRRNIGVGE